MGLKKRIYDRVFTLLLLQLMMTIPLSLCLGQTTDHTFKQDAYFGRKLISPAESDAAVQSFQEPIESGKFRLKAQLQEITESSVNTHDEGMSGCKDTSAVLDSDGNVTEYKLTLKDTLELIQKFEDAEISGDLENFKMKNLTANEEAERPKAYSWDSESHRRSQVKLEGLEDTKRVSRLNVEPRQLDEAVEKSAGLSHNRNNAIPVPRDSASSQQDDQRTHVSETELQDLSPDEFQRHDFARAHDQQEDAALNDIEKTLPVLDNPYLLGPRISDWDTQRESFLDKNPHLKTTSSGKPRVLMITGSDPIPCLSPVGDTFYIKSAKLKMDYARIHNYELYYNFAHLDPLFNSYWAKYPLIRNLMLSHPEVEWFFWADGDVVFTDVLFEPPLDTYEGVNWIMQGYEENLFQRKSWVAINAGVFLVRNCQWTLDLFDKWARYGPDGPLRPQIGQLLTNIFSDRPENFHADDQSVLGYLIMTDEAVRDKVKLIGNEYIMSGYWKFLQGAFEAAESNYHPGLGDWRWPWTMHFVGCSLCMRGAEHPDMKDCLDGFERAYRFADSQVQKLSGMQYESPSSDFLIPMRNETDRPLECLDVNPWADRIAKVQAATAK